MWFPDRWRVHDRSTVVAIVDWPLRLFDSSCGGAALIDRRRCLSFLGLRAWLILGISVGGGGSFRQLGEMGVSGTVVTAGGGGAAKRRG